MLGHSDKDYLDAHLDELKTFPDLSKAIYWGYYDVMEAVNAHDDFSVSNKVENWVK